MSLYDKEESFSYDFIYWMMRCLEVEEAVHLYVGILSLHECAPLALEDKISCERSRLSERCWGLVPLPSTFSRKVALETEVLNVL